MAKKKTSPKKKSTTSSKGGAKKNSPNYSLLIVALLIVGGIVMYGLYQTSELSPKAISISNNSGSFEPISQKKPVSKTPTKTPVKASNSQKKFASDDLESRDRITEEVGTNENLPDYNTNQNYYYTASFDFGWPEYSDDDQIVEHEFYTLSYNEKNELPDWVAYTLTAKNLALSKFPRKDNFKSDPDVRSGSASPKDYVKSGYDRGHLAPAAAFSWTEKGLDDSFYMSNMCPQEPGFNRGIWKNLESEVRDWATSNKKLFVVTGPVIGKRPKKIGKNKVVVPAYFFKAILDMEGPEVKAIGFIMENKKHSDSFMNYAVTIDSLESFTGLNFFPAIPDDLESQIESSLTKSQWQ